MCPNISSQNKHVNFRKDRSMETLSKIGGTEWLDDFSKHFELKKDKIRLKNQKFVKQRKKISRSEKIGAQEHFQKFGELNGWKREKQEIKIT